MGVYVCEAFNGVPPNDTQEFNVHVYCELYIISQKTNIHLERYAVSPTILVAETVVGGYRVKTISTFTEKPLTLLSYFLELC